MRGSTRRVMARHLGVGARRLEWICARRRRPLLLPSPRVALTVQVNVHYLLPHMQSICEFMLAAQQDPDTEVCVLDNDLVARVSPPMRRVCAHRGLVLLEHGLIAVDTRIVQHYFRISSMS